MNRWFVCVCLLLVSIGCGVDTTEKPKDEATWSSKPQSLGCSNDSAGCTNDTQCSQFAQCQTGGWVACSNGRCSGFQPQSYDIDCILKASCNGTVSTAVENPQGNGICGPVTAPPECLKIDANDAVCSFAEGMRPNEDQYRAWLQVTADQPNSTVTIHSLSGYCVHQDGTLTPAGGTAKGEAAITWAGHYRRDTWYNPSDQVANVTLNGNNTYLVPTNPLLLHLGNGGSSVGCREIVLQAVISTTGDAKVELGLDYYIGNSYGHESCVSGWKACTTGKATLMTPRSDKLTCEGDLGSVGNPPPVNTSCDGQVNGIIEVFGGGTKLGECHAGQRQCNNGTWVVISQPVESTPETCDGKDNDCDGAIDDGNVCGTPVGSKLVCYFSAQDGGKHDFYAINWSVSNAPIFTPNSVWGKFEMNNPPEGGQLVFDTYRDPPGWNQWEYAGCQWNNPTQLLFEFACYLEKGGIKYPTTEVQSESNGQGGCHEYLYVQASGASDEDQDGFSSAHDCNTNNSTIHPGANDPSGDYVDQNCNGSIDY